MIPTKLCPTCLGAGKLPDYDTYNETIARDKEDWVVLVKAVSPLFNVPAQRVLGRSRTTQAYHVRHVCMWVLRKNGWALKRIGRASDYDHSSVKYAVGRVKEKYCKEDASRINRAYQLGISKLGL